MKLSAKLAYAVSGIGVFIALGNAYLSDFTGMVVSATIAALCWFFAETDDIHIEL